MGKSINYGSLSQTGGGPSNTEQVGQTQTSHSLHSLLLSLGMPGKSALSVVPKEYHDIAQGFSEENTLSPPPHQPYNCAIDLFV